MPNRVKRPRTNVTDIENWLSECCEQQQQQQQQQRQQQEPEEPEWPTQISAFASELQAATRFSSPHDVRSASAVCYLLRLALSFDCYSSEWRRAAEARLEEHIRYLRATDEDFAASVRSFNVAFAAVRSSAHSTASRQSGDLGRLLKYRGALDSLAFALWACATEQGVRVWHPVRCFDALQLGLLETVPNAEAAIRRLLALDANMATCWGARSANDDSAPGVWRQDGCALLRMQQARWMEAVLVLSQRLPQLDISDGAAGRRARSALHRWMCIGRDAGARHQAFAVLSARAI